MWSTNPKMRARGFTDSWNVKHRCEDSVRGCIRTSMMLCHTGRL